jgi:activating signal cointegrator complex subunit 3
VFLCQAYISQARVQSFSLVSDCMYVAQNSSRLLRGLFEVAIKRGWPHMSSKLLTLANAIDKRLWPSASPLAQVHIVLHTMLSLFESSDINLIPALISDLIALLPCNSLKTSLVLMS